MAEKNNQEGQKKKQFKINKKDVDYSKITSWRLADMEELEKEGITVDKLTGGSLTFSESIDFIHHFAQRVTKEIERDDVREIPTGEMEDHVSAIVDVINQGQDQKSPSS